MGGINSGLRKEERFFVDREKTNNILFDNYQSIYAFLDNVGISQTTFYRWLNDGIPMRMKRGFLDALGCELKDIQ